jgi:hypothetical protein
MWGSLYELRVDKVFSQDAISDGFQRRACGNRISRSRWIDVHRTFLWRILFLDILELFTEIFYYRDNLVLAFAKAGKEVIYFNPSLEFSTQQITFVEEQYQLGLS